MRIPTIAISTGLIAAAVIGALARLDPAIKGSRLSATEAARLM